MTDWKSPIYTFGSRSKPIVIDVTTSISASLPPHKIIADAVAPFWRGRRIETILDFGAGSLRHTFPLLRRGFHVCAVEYKEAFERPKNKEFLKRAKRSGNFLGWFQPSEARRRGWMSKVLCDYRRKTFGKKKKFDAAMLNYVLQTIPEPADRKAVVQLINRCVEREGYLLYMSRFGQVSSQMENYPVSDGFYMRPEWTRHSFYREFNAAETHAFFESFGYHRVRSLSARGTEQIFVYTRGKGTFTRSWTHLK